MPSLTARCPAARIGRIEVSWRCSSKPDSIYHPASSMKRISLRDQRDEEDLIGAEKNRLDALFVSRAAISELPNGENILMRSHREFQFEEGAEKADGFNKFNVFY